MLKMFVYDKKFGQPLIKYSVVDTETNEVLEQGKRKEYDQIGEIYFSLIKKYGQENVKMLSH